MSYDIQIWSVNSIPLPDALPDEPQWKKEGEAWVRPSKSWQIIVSPSDKVLFEDVPEGVNRLLPGIRYLTELNLEPIGAPKSAYKLLGTLSKRLGKASHGVLLNPHAGTLITPSGVKRFRSQRRDERFSVLAMSWWFTGGPLLNQDGICEFVNMLENTLPDALPKRYGLYEPPQHQYAETGKDHFLNFLQEHLDDFVIWYPHRPVAGVSLSCSSAVGPTRQGFRANYVQIEIEAKTLEQPGWDIALDRFWRAASHVIQPFYGDVRTLHGLVRMGATYGSDVKTEFHPVKGPWWTGIPQIVGHALVLGEPYLSRWPKFNNKVQVRGGLGFLSTRDWQTEEEVSNLVGGVPDSLAQRWIPRWAKSEFGGLSIKWNTEYPPDWPFENPIVG